MQNISASEYSFSTSRFAPGIRKVFKDFIENDIVAKGAMKPADGDVLKSFIEWKNETGKLDGGSDIKRQAQNLQSCEHKSTVCPCDDSVMLFDTDESILYKKEVWIEIKKQVNIHLKTYTNALKKLRPNQKALKFKNVVSEDERRILTQALDKFGDGIGTLARGGGFESAFQKATTSAKPKSYYKAMFDSNDIWRDYIAKSIGPIVFVCEIIRYVHSRVLRDIDYTTLVGGYDERMEIECFWKFLTICLARAEPLWYETEKESELPLKHLEFLGQMWDDVNHLNIELTAQLQNVFAAEKRMEMFHEEGFKAEHTKIGFHGVNPGDSTSYKGIFVAWDSVSTWDEVLPYLVQSLKKHLSVASQDKTQHLNVEAIQGELLCVAQWLDNQKSCPKHLRSPPSSRDYLKFLAMTLESLYFVAELLKDGSGNMMAVPENEMPGHRNYWNLAYHALYHLHNKGDHIPLMENDLKKMKIWFMTTGYKNSSTQTILETLSKIHNLPLHKEGEKLGIVDYAKYISELERGLSGLTYDTTFRYLCDPSPQTNK